MRKILIFSIAYIPFVGGAEVAVKEITDRIKDIQFDMVTLHFGKHWPKFERIGNVNAYRIGSSKLFFPFVAFFKALALYKENKYRLIWAVMANRAGFAALFFKIFNPKVKFLLTLQEGDTLDYPKKRIGVFWTLLKPLFRAIFSRADYIQAISNYLADWAREMGAENPIEVVPNGVDLDNFSKDYPEEELKELKGKLNKSSEDRFIIHTGRSVPKNGLDDIIKALKYLPETVKFLVLGTGPDDGNLKKLAKDSEVGKRVLFLGFFEQKEMVKYLKISDVFVRPSLSEGLGNSFLEAMAAEIPIIGTPVGGIPDFLKDGKTGLFCKVKNPKSIAEKVKILLEDSDLRNKIVVKAKEMIIKSYNWDLIAQKMKNIFDKLLAPLEISTGD